MLASTARYEGAYTLAIRLYSRLIGLAASLGHLRAAALVQGRQHTEQYLRQAGNTQGYVWFHASSAGELEQALPLMQAWRAQRPDHATSHTRQRHRTAAQSQSPPHPTRSLPGT
ncbi:MAG: glycosyltransferase N-terminal domain-containing protein [Bacteroidota bacterium]